MWYPPPPPLITEPATHGMHVRTMGAGGTGTPAVLVHGLGVSSRYMLPLARALAPSRPVYAPDLPGFGMSPGPRASSPADMARALAAWMDATGLRAAIVVGHSLGGQTGARLASDRPDLAGRLVLLGPTFDPRARDVARQALRWLASMPWERPAIVPVMAREYLDCGPRRLLATLRLGLEDHLEDVMPRVRAPVLVVRGARDPVAPAAWARRVSDLAPDGRMRAVPGRGHAINFSAGGAVAALIDAFAAEGAGEARPR